MPTTLYTLFMPPEGCFGDFGMFCGFTATPQVLSQIRRTFSGEMKRPALAAFIHPTINAVSDVPGLAWIWMQLKDRGYGLLHAKVALLGFRRSENDGYVVRLAVSTGNWTQEPLTDSIDLYWCIDVDTAHADPQDIADLRAAWTMFDWLRARADCSLIKRDYDGHSPDARLAAAIKALPETDTRPRFIDSSNQPLSDQVIERFSSGKRHSCLILGSGYYETVGAGDAGLPERLRERLKNNGSLSHKASLDLFLNPRSCQGLVGRANALRKAGWELRPSKSTLHTQDARLHAKFILTASGEHEIKGRVYIGSGNLSQIGFETAAAGGNIEAGVVLDLPKGLTWHGKTGIDKLLPVQFSEIVEPHMLQSGEEFVRPEEPATLPPVSWLIWRDGQLSAPEDITIEVMSLDGNSAHTPCLWPAPAPVIVTLATGGWRLPVLSEGVLVVPRPPEMTVEDVLAGLSSFPEPPERDQLDEGEAGAEPLAEASDTPEPPPTTYAIRRMMGLLVGMGEVQKGISKGDWQRWCRELRENLCAIVKQEQAMIGFFRGAGANPLPVLADPRMCPKGVDPALLDAALAAIAAEWKLSDFPSLWASEAA